MDLGDDGRTAVTSVARPLAEDTGASPAAQATEAYLADPALRTALRDAPLPADYRACWAERALGRPLFVDGDELRRTADDCRTLLDLLLSLPRRAWGGDLEQYCTALGIPADRARVAARCAAGGGTVPYGRADLYHDGEAFRLLEFNVASDLGGADRAELQRTLLHHPDFARFARHHHLSYTHTGERLAGSLRSATGREAPRIGLVCAAGGQARHHHLLASFAGMLRRLGLPLTPGELPDLAEGPGGGLTLRGHRVDLVLRFFTVDDVCTDPVAARHAELAMRAHEDGRTVLWTPLDSTLYSNKGALALMSDPEAFGLDLTPDERALTARLLPWTRLVTCELLPHCREQRAELILKPLRECAGQGLTPGWTRDDTDWARALEACTADPATPWIVQRRVVPRAEPVVDPATGSRGDWAVAWGMFFTPDGYAGTDARVAPLADSALINYGTNPATRTTGVFAVS